MLYGAYLAPQQQNKLYNFRFVLMLVSIQLRNPATGSQKANTNPIFSLEFRFWSITQPEFRCIECYLTKTELARDPISVKPSLIGPSIFYFNRLFVLIGPVFCSP